MITSQKFFKNLKEGEEYLSCLMTKEVYASISSESRENIVVNTVRKKNSSFVNDENHKAILMKISKLKKELINYEFDKNY